MSSANRDIVVYSVLLVAIVFAGVFVLCDILRADPPAGELFENIARSYVQPQQGTPRYEYFMVCRVEALDADDTVTMTQGVVIEIDRPAGVVYGSLVLTGSNFETRVGLTFYHLGGNVYSAPITRGMLEGLGDDITVEVTVTSPVTNYPNVRQLNWTPSTHEIRGGCVDFKWFDSPPQREQK